MKKNYCLLSLICLVTFIHAQGWIPNAVQLVHNSASPTLASVKVWVNDTVWANSLSFQQATARASFSSGTHTVGISLSTATAQSQSIVQQTFVVGSVNASTIDSQFLVFNGLSGNASNPLTINTYSRGLEGQPSPFGGFLFFYNGCTAYSALSIAFTPSVSFGTGQTLSGLNINYGQLGRRDVDLSISQISTYTISVTSGTAGIGNFLLPSPSYAQKEVNIVMNSSYNLVQRSEGIGFGLMIVPADGGSVTPVTRIETPTNMEVNKKDEKGLTVFPNPATSVLHLYSDNGIEITNLEIVDLTGKIVMTMASVSGELDLRELEKGVYFLTLTQGYDKRTVKLVKN